MPHPRLSIRIRGRPRKLPLGPAGAPWSALLEQLLVLDRLGKGATGQWEQELDRELEKLLRAQKQLVAELDRRLDFETQGEPTMNEPLNDSPASPETCDSPASLAPPDSIDWKSLFSGSDVQVMRLLTAASREQLLRLNGYGSEISGVAPMPELPVRGQLAKLLADQAINLLLAVHSSIRSVVGGSHPSRRQERRLRDGERLARALTELADRMERLMDPARRAERARFRTAESHPDSTS
ncbi:MAG TPA: hypothetical protein PLI18_06000 [Pirellulaceae bacterium]|nr:hypothetical protein [Pirellulaceae bacterium]